MALSDELKEKRKEDRENIPEELLQANDRHVNELKEEGFSRKGLKPGDVMPDFALKNAVGKKVYSDLLLKNGPLVINFYRGGWCPYCNLELKALQRILPDIRKLKGDLVAISPESPDNSLSTAQKYNLEMEVLTDTDNKVARKFGIVYELPGYLKDVYKGFGLDLSEHNQTDKFELPIPATYVVDSNGRIVYAFANEDFTIRADPGEVINALEKLRKR